MSKPVLVVFAISHYCEKARWALDYLGVEYELKYIAPGIHRRFAQRLGAPASTLPLLVLGDHFVQGSSAIIDWAEANKSDNTMSLAPTTNVQQALDIEQRLDQVLGVHLRRYYYSEALVEHPGTVRPMFTRDLPLFQRCLITLAWRPICKLMIQGMDLGYDQGIESRKLVEAELDWLDDLLADGGRFLSGEALTRTDLTAASLLAPLVRPEQHPTYGAIQLPPRVASESEQWLSRRCLQWVSGLYQHYRL